MGRTLVGPPLIRTAPAKHQEDTMPTFTVLALRHPDDGTLLIAGVIEGDHPTVDTATDSLGFERYATHVEAEGSEAAEAAALAEAGVFV